MTIIKLSIPVEVEVKPEMKDGNNAATASSTAAAAAAYTESLKMILCHVADFHITIVDIISEKYNIPVDEIMKTVTSDSRYTKMVVNPKIHRLTTETTTATETTGATTATETTATKTSSEKKIKIKPKIVPAPAPASAP
jgi:hypothetical protein